MNAMSSKDDFKSRTLAALSEYEDATRNRTVYDETPYFEFACDQLRSAAEDDGGESAGRILEILRRGASDETVREISDYVRGVWPGAL